ncbi:MAG: patatin-like phospholipase family protein [Pseudomonadota bacterium]
MPVNTTKTINLALQGGGAHGAFAWGVLDKLIEDGRLEVEGLCATSAGTMNACAYAYGKYKGGVEQARQTLHDLWWNIAKTGAAYSPIQKLPYEKMLNKVGNSWNMDQSPAFIMFDTFIRMFSPYQWNQFDFNPLKDVLEKVIDFEELQACKCTKLFISATHVHTGRVRVFHANEMTIDVALASACLPFLFKAVEVEGEDYWDGGYMGNPALYPLFYDTNARDLMVVHINPMERPETPTTSPDIMNRINEISFNSSLIKEMRAIAFVKRLISADMLKEEYKCQFKDVLLHSVRADDAMMDLSVASKFNTDWEFLTMLKERGRQTMQDWLDEHFDKVGKKDSVDIKGDFLQSVNRLFDKAS